MKTWLLLAKQGVKTCLGFKFFHLLSSKLNTKMQCHSERSLPKFEQNFRTVIRVKIVLLCSLLSILGVPQMCRTALLSIISTSGTGRWRLKIQIRMKTEHECLLFPGILFKSSYFLVEILVLKYYFFLYPFP